MKPYLLHQAGAVDKAEPNSSVNAMGEAGTNGSITPFSYDRSMRRVQNCIR